MLHDENYRYEIMMMEPKRKHKEQLAKNNVRTNLALKNRNKDGVDKKPQQHHKGLYNKLKILRRKLGKLFQS